MTRPLYQFPSDIWYTIQDAVQSCGMDMEKLSQVQYQQLFWLSHFYNKLNIVEMFYHRVMVYTPDWLPQAECVGKVIASGVKGFGI